MPEKILSTTAVQNFYDRIGRRYDWFEFYEGRAKQQAFKALELGPGTVLAGLARRTLKGARTASLGTAEAIRGYAAS